jgi:hypothetical protein
VDGRTDVHRLVKFFINTLSTAGGYDCRVSKDLELRGDAAFIYTV